MEIKLYTDGGCRGNGNDANAPAGIGCVLLIPDEQPIYHKEKLKFKPNTNNKAEIYAMIRGFGLIRQYCSSWLTEKFAKDDLIIYSDSAYVVNAFLQGWLSAWKENNWKTSSKKDVLNIDLWKRLDQLLNKHEVEWFKVKGHADNELNNRCDFLATTAIKKLNLN